MKILFKGKGGAGLDKDNGHATIDMSRDEASEITNKFKALGIILLILGFCFVLQILVTSMFIYYSGSNDDNNIILTTNGPTNDFKNTIQAATFPTINFKIAGKPDKDFWKSMKPTVHFDMKKLKDTSCLKRNGRSYCAITLPGKGAGDNATCTFFTLNIDGTSLNSFASEMEFLNITICDVVAFVTPVLLDVAAPLVETWNPRFRIVNAVNKKEKEELWNVKGLELVMLGGAEIHYVDGNSIAELEAKIGHLTRVGRLTFEFQLDGMVEGLGERVLNLFEQVQSKGFRLFKTNFSCNGEDNDDCMVDFSFVNANYLWEYINVPTKRESDEVEQ